MTSDTLGAARATRGIAADVTRVALGFLVALGVVWAVLAIAGLADSERGYTYANALVPALLMLGGAYAAWRMIQRRRLFILTPLPLLFGFIALIFGFGPLIHVFQSDTAYVTANFRIPLDEKDIFRVHVLNAIGFSCLMLGMLFTAMVLRSGQNGSYRRSNGQPVVGSSLTTFGPSKLGNKALLRACLAFTLAAGVLRSLDWIYGIDLVEYLPGFLNLLAKIGWLAVLVAAILAARKGRAYWLLLLLPLGIEIVQGFLSLSKSSVLIPFIFVFLGLYFGGKPLRLILGGCLVAVAAFVFMYPLINAGRNLVWSDGRATSAEYYAETFSRGFSITARDADIWMAWSRFNYTPVQHALMQRYDTGQAGATYSELYWMFVPRVMAPGKPILDFGTRATEAVFGHSHSSTGPTIFGEAYWNGGWLYVIVTALLAGGLYVLISLTSIRLFSGWNIVAWPVGLIGILTGVLLQNFFSSGLMATSVAFFCLALLARVFPRLSYGSRSHRSRLAPGPV